jgi:superfamily II DNA or RNA helicase
LFRTQAIPSQMETRPKVSQTTKRTRWEGKVSQEEEVIELEVHAARTYFDGPKKELRRMFRALRLKDKNAYWKQQFLLKKFGYFSKSKNKEAKIEQLKEETKYIKFYNARSRSFASGLLGRVRNRLRRESIDCKIQDRRKSSPNLQPVRRLRLLNNAEKQVEQRPEQLLAVNGVIARRRGILHCSTNFGKTEVAAAIIAELQQQWNRTPRVLFLVHRLGLAKQTKDRFEKHLDMKVRMLGGGKKYIPKRGVLVATVQTAMNMLEQESYKMIEFLKKCDLVFIDELHVNKAGQTSKLMDYCAAPMRIGLSGTINKKDRVKYMHYLGMCGPIIAETRNEELVRLGRSAKPYIRMRRVSGPEVFGENYMECYREGIVRHARRNRMVVREAMRYLAQDKNVVITVARKAHGWKLLNRFREVTEIPCEFIQGSTTLWAREKAVDRFVSGKAPILIVSPIGDVGWDLPAMECWINAAAGKGWELILQRLGRALRKKKGTNKVWVTDFLDEHEEQYLAKHSRLRLKYYKAEEIANIKIVEDI